MNQNEISEIRRRYRSDKSNINKIYGCFVNEQKEIISEFEQSLGSMPQDDADAMLGILKKVLSGTQGRNLIELEFSTAQVSDGEEYKLISNLKNNELKIAEEREALYNKIIENLEIEGNYLIMLASDKYDVFDYGADGTMSDESCSMFSYIICAVCPIKDSKPVISYYMPEKCFRSICADTMLSRPELGFMFPTFDDRKTNIYGALYYTKSIEDSHAELVNALFSKEVPMPAAEQKAIFGEVLEDAIGEECSLRVVRSLHNQIRALAEEHKNEKTEEPFLISKDEVGDMLRYCGIDEEKIEVFEEKFDESFGKNAEISPSNIAAEKQMQVTTPEVSIKVNAECADMVEARVIDGTKYILIRADNGATVNGIKVQI